MRRLEPGFCPISYGLVDLLDVQRRRDIPDKLKRPTSRHDSGESGRSGKPLQATREWLVLSERCFSQSPSRLLGSRRHTTLPLLISLVRCLLTAGPSPGTTVSQGSSPEHPGLNTIAIGLTRERLFSRSAADSIGNRRKEGIWTTRSVTPDPGSIPNLDRAAGVSADRGLGGRHAVRRSLAENSLIPGEGRARFPGVGGARHAVVRRARAAMYAGLSDLVADCGAGCSIPDRLS